MSRPVQVNGLDDSPVVVVSTGAGFVNSVQIANPSAALAYIQFFDVAYETAVTLGTTVPTFWVAASTLDVDTWYLLGLGFSRGLKVAATTTPTGSSAPSAAVNVMLTIDP